jgi:hypothetical protein
MMSSVPRFMVIETAFTAVQWLMVAPLTAFAFSGMLSRRARAAT